jgi:hypothetical protein
LGRNDLAEVKARHQARHNSAIRRIRRPIVMKASIGDGMILRGIPIQEHPDQAREVSDGVVPWLVVIAMALAMLVALEFADNHGGLKVVGGGGYPQKNVTTAACASVSPGEPSRSQIRKWRRLG